MSLVRKSLARGVLVAVAGLVVAFTATGGAGAARGDDQLSKIQHIVVIYEENHSFDNLYGGWEGVNGRASPDAAIHTTQVDQNGAAYSCLLQNDVNLVGLPATCNDVAHGFSSAFANTWWTIDPLIPASATTCPTILGAFAFPFGVPNGTGQRG